MLHSDNAVPLESLFLHYFDTHFSDSFLRNHSSQLIEDEAELALRFALLSAGTVYVPAASYFESDLCRRVVSSFSVLFQTGIIRLVGRAPGLAAFAEEKLQVYDAGGTQHAKYAAAAASTGIHPPFRARFNSATDDLTSAWHDLGTHEEFEKKLFGRSAVQLSLGFSENFMRIPDMLEGRAFTPEYVLPLLDDARTTPIVRQKVSNFINQQYFGSFTQEFEAGTVTDMLYFPTYASTNPIDPGLPYGRTREALRSAGVLSDVADAKPSDLLKYRADPRVIDALRRTIEGTPRSPFPVQLKITALSGDEVKGRMAALRTIPGGVKNATRYHRSVSDLLTDVFSPSLGGVRHEQEINEGRKRIDIVWPNFAKTGFFDWVNDNVGAMYVFAECKNYTGDVENPEVDQLVGRFARWSSRVGILAFRRTKQKDRLINRCRDAFIAGQGLVIPIDDDDLAELVDLRFEVDGPDQVDGWLHRRASRLML